MTKWHENDQGRFKKGEKNNIMLMYVKLKKYFSRLDNDELINSRQICQHC